LILHPEEEADDKKFSPKKPTTASWEIIDLEKTDKARRG